MGEGKHWQNSKSVKQAEYFPVSFLSFCAFKWHIYRYFSPQINIDSCLLSWEGLWVTGGQSAFTALSLPINVFPTNAAGGLMVPVM